MTAAFITTIFIIFNKWLCLYLLGGYDTGHDTFFDNETVKQYTTKILTLGKFSRCSN